jgi:hypothetical protein
MFKSKLVALTGSDQDIFEFPATYDGAGLLFLVNSQNATRDVTVKFYKHATGATTTLQVYQVAANKADAYPVKFGLEAGDKIIASCSSSGVTAFATIVVGSVTPIAQMFNPRGEHSLEATYAAFDIAWKGRNSYLAINGNTNDPPPSSNWMLLAQGGADGADGAPGAPGADGSGTVSTSGSVANNRLAAFDGTTGELIKDSGKAIGDFATAAQGTKVDYLTVTGAVDLDSLKAKSDLLTVTGSVDLDDLKAKVIGLDQAVILKGTWNANAGTFPGAGSAQAGWAYIVGTGGTVDGHTFDNGDRIIAITDNASTSTFAANWFKEDYTDAVLSINGQTGAVTIEAIIHAATAKTTPVDADEFGGVDSAASNVLKKFTWANIKAAIGSYIASAVLTLSNKTLTKPTITGYKETVYAPSAGTAFTIDWSLGTLWVITTSGNCTITLPAAAVGEGGTIVVVYGGTHALTWAGGTALKYAGGTPPTPKGASGAEDWYTIACRNSSYTYIADAGRDVK